MKKNILVFGATGAQGTAIARRFTQEGYKVLSPVRSAEKIELLVKQGVEGILSDFSQGSLAEIAKLVDRAIVVVPAMIPTSDMVPFTQTALKALKASHIERVILHISSVIPEEETGIAGPDARLKMKQIAFDLLPEVTVTSGTLYLENFSLAYRQVILDNGIIPQALSSDVPVSYMSMDDLAEYMVGILHEDSTKGEFLKLGGNRDLTGDELAGIVSSAVNREVVYHALKPVELLSYLEPVVGKQLAEQIAEMYSWEGEVGKNKLLVDSSQLRGRLKLNLAGIEEWSRTAFDQSHSMIQ